MFYKVVAALLLAAGPSWAAEVVDVRTSASDEKSRLVFDLSGPVETRYTGGGDKLTIFVSPIDKPNLKTPIVPRLESISATLRESTLELGFEAKPGSSIRYFTLDNPPRLVVDLRGGALRAAPASTAGLSLPKKSKPIAAQSVAPTITKSEPTRMQVTRDDARKALAKRISEITDNVVAGKIDPAAGRQLLVRYRNVLSAAVAGRDVNELELAEALGLNRLGSTDALEPVRPIKINKTEDVKIALPEVQPAPLPKAKPAPTPKVEPVVAKPQVTKPVQSTPEMTISADQLPQVAAPQPVIAEVGNIRRPVLLDNMDIDFKDPFNPLELLFEAERQLLYADLEAMGQ